jgi:hypothetical protein
MDIILTLIFIPLFLFLIMSLRISWLRDLSRSLESGGKFDRV